MSDNRLGAVALAMAAPLSAQMAWEPFDLARAAEVEICYDVARGRGVAVGTFERLFGTWEWNGRAWLQRTSPVMPGARTGTALAYDSRRGVTVLFGGGLFQTDAETWEWDGTGWTRRSTATTPPARAPYALAYDARRGVVVLFGGWDGSTLLGDTWEYDGIDWRRRQPAHSPPPLVRHSLTYDAGRGVTVLFGGEVAFNVFSPATWEWDGVDWTDRSPAASPRGRRDHAATYDPVRRVVVVFGGQIGPPSSPTQLGDLWEWDGTAWRRGAAGPRARTMAGMFFDPALGASLVYGGIADTYLGERDLWSWDGAGWTELRSTGPGTRYGAAAGFDPLRRRVVLFGGMHYGSSGSWLGDTWEWDGVHWRRLAAGGPEPGLRRRLVPDATGGLLMFGGLALGGASTVVDSTWRWDGTAWTQLAPAHRPAARFDHALAYDAARGRVVLFGGQSPLVAGDTWEWDGLDWIARSSVNSPPPRFAHALEYDAARRVVVLFGGYAGGTLLLGDTWEWDGVDWRQRSPASSPPARRRHGLDYDAARERLVLTGGRDLVGKALGDTWEWDGSDWHRIADGPPRFNHASAYDGAAGMLLAFGGERDNAVFSTSILDDTWGYAPSIRHSSSAYGAGCRGAAGVPRLTTSAPPIVGSRDFALVIEAAAPSAIAAVSLGMQPANVPVPGCCTLLVASLVAHVATATTAQGTATVAAPIPRDPALHGAALYAQGYVADAGGACWGLAAVTGGLAFVIGD